MSLIYLCGDPHGRFGHIVDAVREAYVSGKCPDAVILLGDLECARPLDQELQAILGMTSVWFIPGNHDTDQHISMASLNTGSLAKRNLHGRVVDIAGIQVAGLGGVFRSSIWSPPSDPHFHSYEEWRNGFIKKIPPRLFGEREFREERRHQSSVFPAEVSSLQKKRAQILVTHEAPSCHRFGWQEIDRLGAAMRVTHLFHGHLHERPDYSRDFARMGFQVHGVGFRGISAIDDTGMVRVIREGDYDAGGGLMEAQNDD